MLHQNIAKFLLCLRIQHVGAVCGDGGWQLCIGRGVWGMTGTRTNSIFMYPQNRLNMKRIPYSILRPAYSTRRRWMLRRRLATLHRLRCPRNDTNTTIFKIHIFIHSSGVLFSVCVCVCFWSFYKTCKLWDQLPYSLPSLRLFNT